MWWKCLTPSLLIIPVLLVLLSACKEAEPPPKVKSPTPPPVAEVACKDIMEWIRFRPTAKLCNANAECAIQYDNCCDRTSVHKRYLVSCERDCGLRCPQDSIVGRQIKWQPVCEEGSCILKQILGAADAKQKSAEGLSAPQ